MQTPTIPVNTLYYTILLRSSSNCLEKQSAACAGDVYEHRRATETGALTYL